jgi:hypothetical protein
MKREETEGNYKGKRSFNYAFVCLVITVVSDEGILAGKQMLPRLRLVMLSGSS